MITLPGYRLLRLVYEDDRIWICHVYAEALSRVVLWKMVKEGPHAMLENAKLIHEYEVLALLPMEGVLKPHTLLRQGGSMVLLFDIVHAAVLRQYIASGPMESGPFLQLAIRVCEVLAELHGHELLHMNVRPDTILVIQDSQRICLTGFSDAVPFRQSTHAVKLDGFPPYMAPERTSSSGRLLDGRTDLYSLGVTFFEMLAGELPFQAAEPLEWAHAHMVKQPPSLSREYGVAEPLAAIVGKLLAKEPERRYSSASAVLAELELCLAQLEAYGELADSAKARRASPLAWPEPAPTSECQADSALPEHFASQQPGGLAQAAAGRSEPIRQSGTTPFSDRGYAQMLDLAAVFKASQVFAGEAEPHQRVRKLLLLLLEQAGATCGYWISPVPSGLQVELVAEWTKEREWSSRLEAAPLASLGPVRRRLVETAAADGEVLQRDADVAGKPQARGSVLCMPLWENNRLCGLLYLENRLMSRVFAGERLGALRMAAMQLYYAMRLAEAEARRQPALLESAAVGLLTARETEVLEWMAKGLPNKEIADQLFVTPETVKAHIRNIYGKLNVGRRIQAIEEGRRLRLIH